MVVQKEDHEAILVLSVTQYNDNSAIITGATDAGVQSFFARGIYKAKSAMKPLALVGNYVDVDFRKGESDINIVSSCLTIDDVSPLYQDYDSQLFLSFLQELSMNLFQYGDSFPKQDCIQILKGRKNHASILACLLLLLGSFYKALGLKIHTSECALCNSERNLVSFSLKDGGFICKDCLKNTEETKMDDLDLYVLKYAFMPVSEPLLMKQVPLKNGKRVFIQLVENLIHYFDINHLHSLSMILDIIK